MRLPISSIFQKGQASQAVGLDPERKRAPPGKVGGFAKSAGNQSEDVGMDNLLS